MVRVTFRHCTPSDLSQRSSVKYQGSWTGTYYTTNFLIRIRASPPHETFSTLTGLAHRSIRFSTSEYMRLLACYTLSVPFYRPRRNIRGLCEHPASSSSELDTWWSSNIINSHFVRQLLVTVVRGTFRFHDTTPQGKWYTISILESSRDFKT